MISVLKAFPKFRLLNARRRPRAAGDEIELWRLSLLSLCIGVFTGVGSAVFRALIGLVYNLFYLGRWSFVLDANLLDPPSPWGNLVFFRADRRRADCGVSGQEFCAGSQRARRAGGDGFNLLQGRRHSGGCRCCEVARFRNLDRHGRRGRPRRTDHPDRFGAWFDPRADDAPRHFAKDHASLGRRRRGHRRDLQHAARRRALRHRNPSAGNLQPHLSAGGHRHGKRDIHGPCAARRRAGFLHAAFRRAPNSAAPGRSTCCSSSHWARLAALRHGPSSVCWPFSRTGFRRFPAGPMRRLSWAWRR